MIAMDMVREWLEIADGDIQAAEHLFKTMHKRPLEIICYLCQQAAEKSLKGFLTAHGIEPPYIHDLEKLRLMCTEQVVSFETTQAACLKMRGYAAATRYPNRPEIEEADAVFALKEAKNIYDFCISLIPELTQEQEQEPAQNPEQSMS